MYIAYCTLCQGHPCVQCCVRWGRKHCLLTAIHLSDLLTVMLQCAALSQDDLGDSRQSEQSASATHSALAHPLTYVLSHCACLPSFCLLFTLNPTLHFFFFFFYRYLSPRASNYFISFYFLTTFPSSLTFPLIQPSFLLYPSLVSSLIPLFSHRPTLVGLGGQQAMTVVLAVDCEVTFTQPHWDLTALSERQ